MVRSQSASCFAKTDRVPVGLRLQTLSVSTESRRRLAVHPGGVSEKTDRWSAPRRVSFVPVFLIDVRRSRAGALQVLEKSDDVSRAAALDASQVAPIFDADFPRLRDHALDFSTEFDAEFPRLRVRALDFSDGVSLPSRPASPGLVRFSVGCGCAALQRFRRPLEAVFCCTQLCLVHLLMAPQGPRKSPSRREKWFVGATRGGSLP